ncbi:MAG: molybdate ABC transporter substrate-binding protein [Actinobacteria bacterium]|nr:molybdate ABC transporter substrate-binding protein [Actinomycetota bacterium]
MAHRKHARTLLAVALLVGALTAAGCGRRSTQASSTVTVFAAASLTEVFTSIGEGFEADNPGVEITFNFASSSALAGQITSGAPVDVFASADAATMSRLTDAGGTTGAPMTFARNELVIVVGAGNPRKITSIRDLADPDLIVVLAAPQVPAGRYAAQILEQAGVTVTPKSLEADVKAVLTKVTSGEADAGIVYATDVRAAGDEAVGIAIPEAANVVATYPVAIVEGAPNPAGASAFLAYLTGPKGQATLASFGFGRP